MVPYYYLSFLKNIIMAQLNNGTLFWWKLVTNGICIQFHSQKSSDIFFNAVGVVGLGEDAYESFRIGASYLYWF